ncbi:hypothetical protein [Parvibaculum sp.]|uniref:hypothetical protein n=1 Tax=Parvibaculum sp. TaxID=2024848 RepID=UPI0025F74112|nr:hypothetical protein [Parvibaculum sp.]
MGKTASSCEVIARETISMGGELHKPGSRLLFPADEAQRLVDAQAADWPAAADVPAVAMSKPSGIDLIATIGQAMRAIDPAEGVTPEGKASLYALAHHLGFEVTAEERDAAHAEFSGKRDLFTAARKHDFGDPLLNAIRDLDPVAAANWTQEGKPSANALSEILKRRVDADERDEVWVKYQKAVAELVEKK